MMRYRRILVVKWQDRTTNEDILYAELDQLLLKCISIKKYKLHFFKVIQILFFNYFGYDGQNTKYIS